MESVTTLSLLCTVMQVLSYGSGLISLSRRELKDGSTETTLDDNKIYFKALISILEDKVAEVDSVASSPAHNGGNGAELDSPRRRAGDRLRDLASDLLRDSRALDMMLERVVEIIDLAGLARMAAITRFKVFHQSDIVVLERRIRAARDILSAEFLTGLCTSDEAVAVIFNEENVEMSCHLRRFVGRWAEGQRDIATLIVGQKKPTEEEISEELKSQKINISCKAS